MIYRNAKGKNSKSGFAKGARRVEQSIYARKEI